MHARRTKEEHLQCPNDKSVTAYECDTKNWKENHCDEEERFPLQRKLLAFFNFVNITHTFAYCVFSVFG